MPKAPPDKTFWKRIYHLANAERQARKQKRQKYDWALHARGEQLPPPGDWHTWLILAGRGFGKTRTGAETIRQWVKTGHSKRIALLGHTQADVRKVMIEGESGLLSVFPDQDAPQYFSSSGQLVWDNGATASCYSSDAYEQLRGPQFDTAWVDELAKFTYAQQAWDQLCLTMRLGKSPRTIVTTTPKPIALLQQLMQSPAVVTTQGTTFDNAANLSKPFLEFIKQTYSGTRLGQQELLGQILDENQSRLWTANLFDQHRIHSAPELVKVVVAIDPATSLSEHSCETGVIVAGLGSDQRGYVLADLSGKMSPTQWATQAIQALHTHQADCILAETNNGGNLVEHVLKSLDPDVPYQAVHARHGKYTRAEPIAALYEQGRISHVGAFASLEEQLCAYQIARHCASDRMDALVWAFHDLFFSRGSRNVSATLFSHTHGRWLA